MNFGPLSMVVAALESGKRPKGGASDETGTIPSLGGEHLNNDGGFRLDKLKFIDEDFFNSLRKGVIRKNDILIVKDGATTGKVSYVGDDFPFGKAAINEHLFALTVDATVADPRYVFSFLKSPQGQMEVLKDFRGAAIGGISRGFVDLARIPLPTLDDQIRIAHLLGKVGGLIAQRKQHLQQLDDLLKSVFLVMFGDPVRNEKGWDEYPLSKQCQKITDGTHDTPERLTKGVPFITGKHIRPYSIDYSGCDFVSAEDHSAIYSRCDPKYGDILYTNIGVNLGTAAMNTVRFEFSMKNVALLRPSVQLNSRFLEHYLNFEKVKAKIISELSSGGAQKFLGLGQIKKIVIVIPPKPLQNHFAEIVEKVESIKARYQRSLIDLEALNGAQSQQAFKGELDLSRVPMPGIQVEEEKTVAAEPLHTPAEQGLAINLPDTDNMLDALESAEARKGLISHWLEAYRGQIGSRPFSVQHFMAAVQTRLAELHPDNDFELGANDYEHIKTWVFKALAAGTLTQAFDDTGNRIELKAVQV